MPTHSFTLYLTDADAHRLDEVCGDMHALGFDDSLVSSTGSVVYLDLMRESELPRAEVIAGARATLLSAGYHSTLADPVEPTAQRTLLALHESIVRHVRQHGPISWDALHTASLGPVDEVDRCVHQLLDTKRFSADAAWLLSATPRPSLLTYEDAITTINRALSDVESVALHSPDADADAHLDAAYTALQRARDMYVWWRDRP